MAEEQDQFDVGTAERQVEPARRRVLRWTAASWRSAATLVAVGLALLLTWHVINGKHGLNVWQKKRAEDRVLRKEIDELQQENARLRDHVERLKSDPDAIEHEAREKLHYAKAGEVIYALPVEPQPVTEPTAPAVKQSFVATAITLVRDAADGVSRLFGRARKH